ncbi:alpha-farnesene synthase-like [Corylus avellana]|uniref:alpha-farnesene synthase-like n=1 Tax=Corylus avellana TaxID=13451 RepID=UPI001E21B7F5|nr:alpha-farnesene synthase-like [Corylus avellana]
MDCKKPLRAEQQSLACQIKSEALDMIQQRRRSANYKPNIWKYDYLQSLTSIYDGLEYKRRAEKLTEVVRSKFAEAVGLLAKLELIDNVKKLGLAIHFDMEILEALDSIASIKEKILSQEEDLYAIALCFRLLRQHGYFVSQDMFSGFMDEKTGAFRKSIHANFKGMLELLEASYLALEGENILDEAKQLSTAILKENTCNLDGNLAKQVAHALELPSQRRVQWFDVKWHINVYEKDRHMNPILLEFAKLNFNIIQATLQKDLRELSRWWRNLGVTENLNFARDRLVETFMCSVGFAFEPRNKCFRKWLTKVLNLIAVIDDVYDVYGTLEELNHFTTAVNRWDVRETQELPECMKICFLALYNTTNELANEIQTGKRGNQLLPHLKKVWTDFCTALFVEAKWYNMGYTPSLQEYLSNAWISSSGSVMLVHAFFCIEHEVEEEFENFLKKNQDLVYNISMIIRLCNDLGTSKAEIERGDVPSSIMCYMREENVSEEIARKHIKGMINKTWKKINGQCFTQLPMLQSFVNIAANVARVANGLYHDGDGFGVQDQETRSNILSLLVEPLMLS